MSPRLKNLTTALALALFFPTHSPAEELTEEQKSSIISQLDQLLNRRESGATSGSSLATSRLKTAATSDSAAVALYVECVKRERFERAEKPNGDFTDWKSSRSDAFRTKTVGTCLRAHAAGLVVALQIANTVDRADPKTKEAAFIKILPEIFAFTELASTGTALVAVMAAEERKNNDEKRILGHARNIAGMNLFDSDIAKTLNISAYIRIPENFPTNLSGANNATESFLLPRLYEFGKLPPIDEAWTKHIARLTERMNFYKKEKLIAQAKDLFEKALPLARWAQARDRFTYGTDKVAGATAMLDVIRTHLDHEFCVTWIEEFKSLVSTTSTPEAASL